MLPCAKLKGRFYARWVSSLIFLAGVLCPTWCTTAFYHRKACFLFMSSKTLIYDMVYLQANIPRSQKSPFPGAHQTFFSKACSLSSWILGSKTHFRQRFEGSDKLHNPIISVKSDIKKEEVNRFFFPVTRVDAANDRKEHSIWISCILASQDSNKKFNFKADVGRESSRNIRIHSDWIWFLSRLMPPLAAEWLKWMRIPKMG